MRILHVDSGLDMRGGQWQVLYLLRGLRERGHELRLQARGKLLERALAEGFQAHALGWRVPDWGDVVHAHDARSHSLAALSGLHHRPAFIVSRRVAFPVRTGIVSRWKYSRPDHYIAVSDGVRQQLVASGIKFESISVVYDGVPVVSEWGAPAQGLVMAAATTDPMKGSELVREAARIAGVDVVFSENLAGDIAGASIFVYISHSEGLGSAALLAMAQGIPVVASRIGGLIEVVEDGESGLLVANDAADIAKAVGALLDNAALREQMGRAGRAIVEKRFSLASMVEGTVRIYEKVGR